MCLRTLPLLAVGLSLLVSDAQARGYRPDQVPGGQVFECYMCHYREPFVRLTVFGIDVRETLLFREDYPEELPPDFFLGPEGNVDWPTVALLDSDGDGYTNGEELGDPEGLFRQFDEPLDFAFSRPDLPEDTPCGSGTVEGPEACDGDAFDGATCVDYGFTGGVMSCRDDCTVDTGGCTVCGDGVLEPGEECDDPVEAPCGAGFEGVVRCVDCRLDRADCQPLPDMAPPPDMGAPDAMSVVDAAPDAMDAMDAALDAMDAMSAMPDAISDAISDAMGAAPDAALDAVDAMDAMPDAISDASRATPDAMPSADGGSRDAGPPTGPDAPEDGCRQGAPDGTGPFGLLALALLLIRRRR